MSGSTLLRQLLMLHCIPREPQKWATSRIAERLADHGYGTTIRTVQRDLNALSTIFKYSSEEHGRTQFWFYPAKAKLMDLPAMDQAAALAFVLTREHITHLLPPTTLEFLRIYFARAEEVLREATPTGLASWRSRVQVVTRGPRLRLPRIRETVQQAVYDAVLNQRQLELKYRGRGADQTTAQRVHPLGLMVSDGVIYLVATAWDYSDPRHYALHRIEQAQCTEESARRPEGFELADHVRRESGYPRSDRTLRLVARFDPGVAVHLEERPLGEDQKLERADDYTEITATVADTDELRWWLLGFGAKVEVMKPASLRADMRARARAMARLYGA